MTDRPNRVGQQLGNYRLIRVLGEGGFAEVYLAEHIYLKTQVAIKVLQEKIEAQYVEGFLKEAQTIAALKHPHILRVLDFGMENSRPFLVVEYAPGGTLRKKHPRGSKVPLPTVVSYVKQVAMALQYAHDQKIVHRDVKPENVLVEADGKIVLGDFGIATPAHQTQSLSTQEAAGTVSYMAPEQIQGKPRAASDQYSLGIIVYEWLCGARPFEGTTAIEIAMHHLNDPPLLLREKMPMISLDVEHVVMTALAKDPKQRFGSVQAFATALEQASQPEQSKQSVSLREITPPSQLLSSTVTVTPPKQILEPITEPPPPSTSSQVVAFTRSKLHVPQPLSHPSRRMVIAGLVGLTLVGGSITWFATLHSPTLGTTSYTYRGHSDQVYVVAWSPNGKRIASGSYDKTVQVWDAVDGGNVSTYRGHSNSVLAVAWSPDERIASGSSDNTMQVWDAVDGSNVFTYTGHSGWVYAVAWSPNGKRIASGSSDNTVQVWDATNGSNVFTYTGHSGWVDAVAWSPDGKRIASGSGDNTVQVWDAVDGRNVYTYKGHSSSVNAVAWSPDGKRIASGSSDNTVQVWDATNGSNVFTYTGHSGWVDAVAWSPDGKRIASGSGDNTVQVWDTVDGRNVYTYKGHSSSVNAVAWSPDGKRIASSSSDHTVQVWVAS